MSDVNFFGFDSLFAARLRSLIDSKGISKQQLADAIGVSRQAISQYSDGSTIPNAEKLFKIAEYFDVSLDYLTGRTESFTIDEELKFVCKYTGISEKTIDALHYWAISAELEWFPPSNEFLNLLIENFSVDLCGFAQNYKKNLKKTIEAKKDILNKADTISSRDRTIQAMFDLESKSNLFLFELKETFDRLIDLFVKDEKAENQDLDSKLLKAHFYLHRDYSNYCDYSDYSD